MTRSEIWETYASAWKAESTDEKRSLLEKAVLDDCTYTDPTTQRNGHHELIEYMMEFHDQVPGGHFVTTYFLEHHARCIVKWEMRDGDGTVLGDGLSYGTFSANGNLETMTGFFETPS